MKRLVFFALVALCMGSSAMAWAKEPAENSAATTVGPSKFYHRFYAGYAPTIFYTERGDKNVSDLLNGFNVGWMSGFNVTKCRLPLYTEVGVKANVGLGDFLSDFDKYLAIEIPVNVAYRFAIPNTKIHLSPYLGVNFKVNALGKDEDGLNYFDIDGTRRFQFGMQVGGHFDFNHFYLGLGFSADFLPIFEDDHLYKFGKHLYDNKVHTCGVYVNAGVVF